MLQIVARYADAWNTAWHVDPAVVKQRYEELKEACAVVGRDPAAIELTAGTVVSLQPGENAAPEKVISGSPKEIASRLQGFADVGVTHLIVRLDPLSVSHIEQFGRIVELLRQR
jgi:alkanesulfonate monooxygenase SsuD/methylene tetrahydromethanopterin reductase-like flavin-dependent oxidoreductase (luciferase family)